MQTDNKKFSGAIPLRLLIIDKSKINCTGLRGLQAAYEIFYADNFNAGLCMAREYTPALLIVNLLLEETDFRVQLKRTIRTSRIPVLAIIQKHDMNVQTQSILKECDDFIQSPFDEAELLLRVRIMLINRLQLHERYVNFIPQGNIETTQDHFLKRIKGIIEENLNNPLFGVSDLAIEACISQPQLYRKLIALTGYSPNTYIRHIRLKHAARLLSNGAGTVSEIAYRVGFNSLSYFAKCFKAVHLCAPRQMLQ